jgi:hypothetical protein
MKRPEIRHYSEEELLMHILGEEDPKEGAIVAAHLGQCHECRIVLREYQQALGEIYCLRVDEIPEAVWQWQKERLMEFLRAERRTPFKGIWVHLGDLLSKAWNYAMTHPLPALGYIALALVFASQRTISIFRLDQILPTTGEVIQVLRIVL